MESDTKKEKDGGGMGHEEMKLMKCTLMSRLSLSKWGSIPQGIPRHCIEHTSNGPTKGNTAEYSLSWAGGHSPGANSPEYPPCMFPFLRKCWQAQRLRKLLAWPELPAGDPRVGQSTSPCGTLESSTDATELKRNHSCFMGELIKAFGSGQSPEGSSAHTTR